MRSLFYWLGAANLFYVPIGLAGWLHTGDWVRAAILALNVLAATLCLLAHRVENQRAA